MHNSTLVRLPHMHSQARLNTITENSFYLDAVSENAVIWKSLADVETLRH